MLFMMFFSWTDQGVRSIKDAPKRAMAARDLGKRMGVEIKQVYLTTGEADQVAIVEAANDDSVAKFAMALGAAGNVRTRTVRAWSETEAVKLISELP